MATFDDPFEPEPSVLDDADAARRVDALALFGLLPAELRLLLPEPFALRVACFRLLDERVLAWAIAPP
jgi:hypothetical protein